MFLNYYFFINIIIVVLSSIMDHIYVFFAIGISFLCVYWVDETDIIEDANTKKMKMAEMDIDDDVNDLDHDES